MTDSISDTNETLTQLLSNVENNFGDSVALDLLHDLGAHPVDLDTGQPPEVSYNNDQQNHIIVVGAGIAGLTLAYELAERGANVELWEASSRAGGRNLTVRRGDIINEIGQEKQVCNLPTGSYFNAGPGRISHHHRAVLHYCRKFNLGLRPYLTLNRASFLHRWIPGLDKDIVIRNRQVEFDGLGQLGELAAKSEAWLNPDDPLSSELKTTCQDWLRDRCDIHFSDESGQNIGIDAATGEEYYINDKKKVSGKYQGSGRQGYAAYRGDRNHPGRTIQLLSLEQILSLRLWYDDPRRSPDTIDEQISMFELENGNDSLVNAFVNALGEKIVLRRKLEEVKKVETGGVILRGIDHSDRDAQTQFEIKADRVILALQPQAMEGMSLDLPADRLQGLKSLPARFAVKVGGWMARRFWEEDDAIYGGISFTNLPIQQIWYPNDRYMDPSGGFLVLAYAALKHGEALGNLSTTQRMKAAVTMASRIHPQIKQELDESSLITIAWQNMPYIRSPWVAWTPELYKRWFPLLSEPCGPIAFAGDWCSHLPAWQEGSIRSAYSLLQWALN